MIESTLQDRSTEQELTRSAEADIDDSKGIQALAEQMQAPGDQTMLIIYQSMPNTFSALTTATNAERPPLSSR